MKFRESKFSFLVGFGLFIFFSSDAYGCNCFPQSDCFASANASRIFTGKLIKIEKIKDRENQLDVYFKAEENHKGTGDAKVKLRFRHGECIPDLVLNEEYLVFQEPSEIQSLCNRTDLLVRSKNTLKYVKSLIGSIPKFTIGGILDGLDTSQIKESRLLIIGPNGPREVSFDDVGMFNFVTEQEGVYKVHITLPMLVDVEVFSDWGMINDAVTVKHEKSLTSIEYETRFKPNHCDVRQISLSAKQRL